MSKRQDDKKNSEFIRLERLIAEEIAQFLFQLGSQFVKVSNADAAFSCYKYSVDLNKRNQAAVYNLGVLYELTGNLEGAHRMFSESSKMLSAHLPSKVSLANVCRKMGKFREASDILDLVYKVSPQDFTVLSAIATLNYDVGNISQALEMNERAIEKNPNDSHLLLNRALINMIFGRWAEHWSLYEFCLSYQRNEKMRKLSMSGSWGGQEMEGRTILVLSDQGHGDAIQFSRYLKDAKKLGKFGKIVYLVQPDLLELLSRVDGVDEAIGFGERFDVKYDAYSSLLGIMRVLKVTPDNCSRPPHIVTDERLDLVWQHRIEAENPDGKRKIGVVWAGDPKHGNDHARSIGIDKFRRIFAQDAKFYSFQVGPRSQDLNASDGVVDLGSEFRSFDDTASALKHMDLLITVDTSMAHLGGSMGTRTWVLVPNPPEWRWLTGVVDSPWYASVELFRQSKPREWESVIDVTIARLGELL